MATDAETKVRELEAFVIPLLGRRQREMQFQVAKEWAQLPHLDAEDLYQGGKVDARGFPRRWVKGWNEKHPAE